MLVRFGFVAMSVTLENASPSKTVTYKTYQSLARRDPQAARARLLRTARENLANCLRLLRHCKAHNVKVYRFSSRIIPLATHPELAGWDYINDLKPQLAELGEFIRANKIRVTFHPDHFTLINTPNADVFKASVADLRHYCRVLNAMGLDARAKLITHVGGGYSNKVESLERFVANWGRIPRGIAKRVTLENDDKTFTARETLYLCEKLQLPLVLDIHHFRCNHEDDCSIQDIYPRFIATWAGTGLPPKIHVSSPRSDSDMRSHHDYVHPGDIYPFLTMAREYNTDLDVMVEAKQKDKAMFKLVQDLSHLPGIVRVNESAVQI